MRDAAPDLLVMARGSSLRAAMYAAWRMAAFLIAARTSGLYRVLLHVREVEREIALTSILLTASRVQGWDSPGRGRWYHHYEKDIHHGMHFALLITNKVKSLIAVIPDYPKITDGDGVS